MTLKVGPYKTVIRPAMLYRSECWALDQKIKQLLNVAKMRILRWRSGMSKENRIHMGSLSVLSIVGKMKRRLPSMPLSLNESLRKLFKRKTFQDVNYITIMHHITYIIHITLRY